MNFKITALYYISFIVVCQINAILLMAYSQLILRPNILTGNYGVFDMFITIVTVSIFIMNIRIPYATYEETAPIESQFTNELSDITAHIFVSFMCVLLTITLAFLFTL